MTPLHGKMLRAFAPPKEFLLCSGSLMNFAIFYGYHNGALVVIVDHGTVLARKEHLIFFN